VKSEKMDEELRESSVIRDVYIVQNVKLIKKLRR
jgi:hypothetical protein